MQVCIRSFRAVTHRGGGLACLRCTMLVLKNVRPGRRGTGEGEGGRDQHGVYAHA